MLIILHCDYEELVHLYEHQSCFSKKGKTAAVPAGKAAFLRQQMSLKHILLEHILKK